MGAGISIAGLHQWCIGRVDVASRVVEPSGGNRLGASVGQLSDYCDANRDAIQVCCLAQPGGSVWVGLAG